MTYSLMLEEDGLKICWAEKKCVDNVNEFIL